MTTKKKTIRDTVVSLFMGFAGQGNTLTIQRPFIDLCKGDHLAALLLSQILYWQDRTDDPDGWFAKSYEDWQHELALTDFQVKRLIKGDSRSKTPQFKLADVGVETKLRKSKHYGGAPTVHYRVNLGKLRNAIFDIVEKPISDNVENQNPDNVENPYTETIQRLQSSAPTGTDAKSKPRDELIDVLTTALFKAQLTDKASVRNAAVLAAWIRGSSTGTKSINVGKNEYPSNDPQDIPAFVKWWQEQYPDAHPPTSISKFPRWWRQWKAQGPGKSDPYAGTFAL